MTCASCATKVSTVVSEVPGVIATGVDLDAGTLKVNGPDAEDSALRAAIASNRPTVLTLRLNQELADPFRRDAFKPTPTRLLEKYRSLSG